MNKQSKKGVTIPLFEEKGNMRSSVPGKTQSKFGVGAGLIFCLIGVFIVIPTFGLFGVFWTAIAGWITYTCYRNGFTDEQIDSHVIEIEDDDAQHTYANTTKTMSAEEAEERLRKLQNL